MLGVAIATTEVSALAMTHIKMDGVVLLWQDEYGATRGTLLAFSQPYESCPRRRAAGWIRTLRNVTGLEIAFDRELRALPM